MELIEILFVLFCAIVIGLFVAGSLPTKKLRFRLVTIGLSGGLVGGLGAYTAYGVWPHGGASNWMFLPLGVVFGLGVGFVWHTLWRMWYRFRAPKIK